MTLDKNALSRLNNFLGYGNLNAPYWFLGMEEGTAGSYEVEANVKIRAAKFRETMDLALAHDKDHLNYPMELQSSFTQVWMYAAKLIRGIRGFRDWQDSYAAKKYVATQLGRASGETFLTELLPLPKPNTSHWPDLYSQWYGSHEAYKSELIPYRVQLLRKIIKERKPRYIFAYGKNHHPYYLQIFETTRLQKINVNARIAVVGTSSDTQLILLPFFGNGAISHADLGQLVDYLKRS